MSLEGQEKAAEDFSAVHLTIPLSRTSILEDMKVPSGENAANGEEGIELHQIERFMGDVAVYSQVMSAGEKLSSRVLITEARVCWHVRMKPCR